MKFEDIKKLPPELALIAAELVGISARQERIEEKMEAILGYLRGLNEGVANLDKALDDDIKKFWENSGSKSNG